MLNGTIRKMLKESFYRKHRDTIEDTVETFETIAKFIIAAVFLYALLLLTGK